MKKIIIVRYSLGCECLVMEAISFPLLFISGRDLRAQLIISPSQDGGMIDFGPLGCWSLHCYSFEWECLLTS